MYPDIFSSPQRERAFFDFTDRMRNPNSKTLYPFNMQMIINAFSHNNVFYNFQPDYAYGEETICAYFAYCALTDPDFDICVMANTEEKFSWIMGKIRYFIKKSRFSLIMKLLAYSRLNRHYYIGSAKYSYIAQYEYTFDLDDNCFVGWVHPKMDDCMTDCNRAFTYGVNAIEPRMKDRNKYTIISGHDLYDILHTNIGKDITYYNALEDM